MLRSNDLEQFPSLSLESHLYPKFSDQLRLKGLWTDACLMRSHHFEQWEGKAMGSLSTIPVNSLATDRRAKFITLDFDPGIDDSVAIVVLKENSEHPAIYQLLESMQQWLLGMTQLDK